MAWLKRMWQAAQVHRRERQLRAEFPGLDQAIDDTPPDDVEPVARYLWAATCWDRQGQDWEGWSLAAVIWLNYGRIWLPDGARPLDDADVRGIPAPPYGQRTDVTS